MSARYALYYAPEATHPLWRAGCDWLRRDAENGAHAKAAALGQIRDLDRFTAAPRRYGFHATIKAPFELTPGITAQDLHVALARYARAQSAFTLPPLKVASLNDFLALIPGSPEPLLARIEREVVEQFDAFRAVMTAAELAQRRAADLDPVEREFLQRWGYPYVLERFRFHISLTGSLSDIDRKMQAAITAAARAHFEAALSVPLGFDALCIFVETERDADFRLAHRVAFGAERYESSGSPVQVEY